jgi:four helix bundle protein
MSHSSLEDLEIYNEAVSIANKIWEIVICWNGFEKETIGSQLCRAIDSVGANIAEGYGRGSKKVNARFVIIARASLFESKHWLIQSNTRKLLPGDIFMKPRKEWKTLFLESVHILTTFKRMDNE